MTPTDEQHRAIKAIVDWYENEPDQQEFFLDGEAGTGKSTTAQIALRELRNRHQNIRIEQAAYTAKAALVMRQKGAPSAGTIHRMIYKADHDDKGKLSWRLWETGPASRANLIVIDEVSMVNDKVAGDLRGFGVKILVLGDVNGQLPPIHGQGAFTRREPDFRLIELNRFAMEDPINALAQRARKGQRIYPAFSDGNVEITYLNPDMARKYLYSADTQLICGRHKVRWATTRRIRERLGFNDPLPRVGEPIICCQNNYKLGILNGEMKEATSVFDEDELMLRWWKIGEDRDEDETDEFTSEPIVTSRHLFDEHYADKKLPEPAYDPEVAWFDFAYMITCHKAQGSEWPHVTIIDDSKSFAYMGDTDTPRRWLYTAITRASEGLTLLLRK